MQSRNEPHAFPALSLSTELSMRLFASIDFISAMVPVKTVPIESDRTRIDLCARRTVRQHGHHSGEDDDCRAHGRIVKAAAIRPIHAPVTCAIGTATTPGPMS